MPHSLYRALDSEDSRCEVGKQVSLLRLAVTLNVQMLTHFVDTPLIREKDILAPTQVR
jgi:hypothetical protein